MTYTHNYYSSFLTNVFGTNADYTSIQPVSMSIFVRNNKEIEFIVAYHGGELSLSNFQKTIRKIIKQFMKLFSLKLDNIKFSGNNLVGLKANCILVPDNFDEFMTLAKMIGIRKC